MSDPKQNPQAVAAATGGKRAEQSIVIGVNDSTVARFHELRKKVDYPTSTSPLFLICPCGVRSSLAVEGEPSEPCAICSKQIDGGAG